MKCENCKHTTFTLVRHADKTKDTREVAELECRLCGLPVSVYGRIAKLMKIAEGLRDDSPPTDLHESLAEIQNKYSSELLRGNKLASSALTEISEIIRKESQVDIEWLRRRYSVRMKTKVSPLITRESDREFMISRNKIKLEVMKEVAKLF